MAYILRANLIKDTCKSILNYKPEDDSVAGLGQFIIEMNYIVSGSPCVKNRKQFVKSHSDISWENNILSENVDFESNET